MLERRAWWLANRPKHPTLLDQEFEAVVAFLEHSPNTLAVLREIGRAGVRRKLMPGTRHHVYYVVTDDVVLILTIANAQGRHLPDVTAK